MSNTRTICSLSFTKELKSFPERIHIKQTRTRCSELCPVSLGHWREANERVNGSHFRSSIVRVLLSDCTGRMKNGVANVLQGLFDKCRY